MAKEFRTYDELVDIMESRGIRTDESTIPALMRESYYAIINGYKSPFLDREKMQSCADDVYKEGTRFDWIYTLFLFDRDLRSLTFEYLTKAEAVIRTSVVYAFCKNHQRHDAYLDRSNYARADDALFPKAFSGNRRSLFQKNMSGLMETLNSKLSDPKKQRPFIRHYLETYGAVPLWVLSNDLTFGNISHFYQLMKRGDQNYACKLISETQGSGARIEPHDLLKYLRLLVSFRNKCAHDERVYCARVGEYHYAEMVGALGHIIPMHEMAAFIHDSNELFDKYNDRIKGTQLSDLIDEMGFPLAIEE